MAALALASGVGLGLARHAGYLGGLKSAPALVVSVPVRTISDTLRPKETVSQLFVRRGVNDVNWSALAQAVRSFDPQRVRAGLVFLFQQRHGDAEPFAVNARVSRDERLWLRRAFPVLIPFRYPAATGGARAHVGVQRPQREAPDVAATTSGSPCTLLCRHTGPQR